jgi:NADPH2:quinone reductase
LFHYIATREAFERRCADMFGWIADGRLQVRIDRKFPLAEASEAHKYMEARKTKGKVLLVP